VAQPRRFEVAGVSDEALSDLRARLHILIPAHFGRDRYRLRDHADSNVTLPHEFVPEGEPPREWYERLYNIQRWTVSVHGGHFAAIEEPESLADDIRSYFS
jgi:hypothetical protein